MNKKKIIAFVLMTSLIAGGACVGFSATKSEVIGASDQNTITLDYSDQNELFNDETITTDKGNKIEAYFYIASTVSDHFIHLNPNGYFKNVDPIRGMTSFYVEFAGTLSVDLKYEGQDDYVRKDLPLVSGETLSLGIETPDYFSFHTSGNVNITKLVINFGCASALPSEYADHYMVGSGSFVSENWTENGGIKLDLNPYNKDLSCVEYQTTVELDEGDEFKIKSGDNWYGGEKFNLDADGTAFKAAQLSSSWGQNIVCNGHYEFTIYFKVGGESLSWIGEGEAIKGATPIPANTTFYLDLSIGATMSWSYFSSGSSKPTFGMVLFNGEFDTADSTSYKIVTLSLVSGETKILAGRTAGGPWNNIMFVRWTNGTTPNISNYANWTLTHTWDGVNNMLTISNGTPNNDAVGTWSVYSK